MTKRTEYRVVGEHRDGSSMQSLVYLWPESAREYARHAINLGDTNVRIQTRTVIESRWVDLEEHPHE